MYGVIPRTEEVLRELVSLFGGDVQFLPGNPDEDQRTRTVWESDLILCGFGPDVDEDKLIGFLGRVIAAFGSWSYLPQVVVGAPDDPAKREQLLRLAASAYLPVDTSPERIARKVFDTWRGTWWQTECQQEVPVLVVNREGFIERANPFAVRRFGPGPLVGRAYMDAVEDQPGVVVPPDHPVARTFTGRTPHDRRWGQSVSVEHQYRDRADQEQRFFLTCTPLVVPSGSLRSAAVSLFDMSRWSRIIEASDRFARAKHRGELLDQIVEQASRLGFGRVRLYELIPGENRLYGRAAIGFRDPANHKRFVSEFWIRADDGTTVITLGTRRYARLYVHGEGKPAQFTEYLPGPRTHPAQLEFEDGNRWIEAPIFLPPDWDGREPEPWGKLSLDLGTESDQLTARDVGDVAVYCSIVGHALAMMRRVEREGQQRERLRQLSADLVTAIKPDERILDECVARTLRLILDVTGGETALYRRYDRQHPAALRRVGRPEFRTPGLRDRLAACIPLDIPRGHALGGYFRHFATGDSATTRAYVADDPVANLRRFASEIDTRYGEWLKFIRSELHIPVFRGGEVVGAILVSSDRDDAFPPAVVEEVEQFVHAISLGIESARRHDDWLVMGDAVRRVVGLLPRLAEIAPHRDDAFFASLATLLSAAQGLRWNRVFVFSCQATETPPGVAELVYALGGLAAGPVGEVPTPTPGTPDPTGESGHRSPEHRVLQEKVRKDPRFVDLAALVEDRIHNPEPHWRSGSGEMVRDLLYELVVAGPRRAGRPIRVDEASPPVVGDPTPGDRKMVEDTNPVRTLLQFGKAELPPECDPLTIQVNVHGHANQWVIDCAKEYPGMFDPSDKAFGFLLRGSADPGREPLGVVLVDMQSVYEVDEQDMIAATRLFLRLASDLLADRYRRRRQHGIINSLPARCHGPTLLSEWRAIHNDIKKLLAPLNSGGAPPDPREVAKVLSPKVAAALQEKMTKFGERMTRLDGTAPLRIENLGGLLREWRDYYLDGKYHELTLAITWDKEVENLCVPCDPLVLRDAVGALIDNTRDESIRCGRRLRPHLHGQVVETDCKAMPRVVELLYEDDGNGIKDHHRRRILIDGYTLAEDPTNKGRGLALIKRQLLEYQGCLECVAPAVGTEGARFIIQLGIPAVAEHARKEQAHVAASDR
jgi:hypothetical protein